MPSRDNELTSRTAVPGSGSATPKYELSQSATGPLRAMPKRNPDSLGGYRIERVLGEGGMGVVYYALDEELQRPAAVKVITPMLADSDMAIERLRTEARSAARLSHPNIVSVYAFGEQNGLNYIAYEFVDGTDLASILKTNGPLEPKRALNIIRQTAQALRFAWANHIVHRDIKPANLLILRDDVVKVADFGLAKRLDMDAGITTSSMVVGSPAYMSPEQGMGRPVDFRSDIYSLGCTLYACLTGSVPFMAETPLAVLMMHAQEPLPEPPNLRNSHGGALLDLLHKMMAKTPEERHRSYDELIQDIDALLQGATIAKPTRKPVKLKRRANPAIQKAFYILGGLGIVLFGVFVFILYSDSRPPKAQALAVSPATASPAPVREAPPPQFEIAAAGADIGTPMFRQRLANEWMGGNWEDAAGMLQAAIQSPEMTEQQQTIAEELLGITRQLEAYETERFALAAAHVPFEVRIPGRANATFRVESVSPEAVHGVSSDGQRGDYVRPNIQPPVKNSIIVKANEIQQPRTHDEKFIEMVYRLFNRDPGVEFHFQSFLGTVPDPAQRDAYARRFEFLTELVPVTAPPMGGQRGPAPGRRPAGR